jgi:hypothetical protein
MNTWLYRQFSGGVTALASWQPTHQSAVKILRRTLKTHEKRGRSIDPSRITGELEHRYSVCQGSRLIAVYWLSAQHSQHTITPAHSPTPPRNRVSNRAGRTT